MTDPIFEKGRYDHAEVVGDALVLRIKEEAATASGVCCTRCGQCQNAAAQVGRDYWSLWHCAQCGDLLGVCGHGAPCSTEAGQNYRLIYKPSKVKEYRAGPSLSLSTPEADALFAADREKSLIPRWRVGHFYINHMCYVLTRVGAMVDGEHGWEVEISDFDKMKVLGSSVFTRDRAHPGGTETFDSLSAALDWLRDEIEGHLG